MALINCPECGKEISDTVKKCPNCGVKIKTKKSAGSRLAIIIIICLLVIGGAITGTYFYVNNQVEIGKTEMINQKVEDLYKSQAEMIDQEIEDFFNFGSDNGMDIISVKAKYEALPDEVKKYVKSAKKLSEYKIEITSQNFDEFFEVKVDYSGLEVSTKPGLIWTDYYGTCNQNTIIQPRTSFKCHDVYVSIDYGVSSSLWFGCSVSHLRINDDGTASDTKEVTSPASMLKPSEPITISTHIRFSDVSGYITFE